MFCQFRINLPFWRQSPSAATNNISSRLIVGESIEPVKVNWYVEVSASSNGATSGNITVRLRSGTSPTTDGTTDVMAANTLAYNASEKLNVNPTHTTLTEGTYLQVDITGAPTGGQADDLTLILYGVPQWAKNL
ncbi:MAG: hypothetical protein HY001_05445 [Candidatus Portnoybacteria bacterium]|nr:hypothetical protein [Candidatus Portnoybacteria bacterium]